MVRLTPSENGSIKTMLKTYERLLVSQVAGSSRSLSEHEVRLISTVEMSRTYLTCYVDQIAEAVTLPRGNRSYEV